VGQMPVLRFIGFGVPLSVRVEDLGYGKLFPGLNVHVLFGMFGQTHGAFRHWPDDGVLVNVCPGLRWGGPRRC